MDGRGLRTSEGDTEAQTMHGQDSVRGRCQHVQHCRFTTQHDCPLAAAICQLIRILCTLPRSAVPESQTLVVEQRPNNHPELHADSTTACPFPVRPLEPTVGRPLGTREMAIIHRIPQFDVYVFVNGQPAKEYRLPQRQHGDRAPAHRHPTVHTNECYIESQSGQSYTVEVDVWLNVQTTSTEAVLCTLSVDGQKVQARIVEDNGPRRLPGAPEYYTQGINSWPRRCSFAGRYGLSATSQGVTREKLVFAPVTTGKCYSATSPLSSSPSYPRLTLQ